YRPNSQLYSAAQSREQAGIIFDLAAKIVRMSPTLSRAVTVRDTAKQLVVPEIGTKYKALSAEVSTSFGLSPVLIVHDELGQVRGPKSELYEALETATSAQEEPMSIIISTQAPTESDLLSILIDDAVDGNDPRTVVSLYTADVDIDPFSEKAIRQANPAFGDFQNAEEILSMARDAQRMSSRESDYRNLILNQRVEAINPFVSRSLWKSCGERQVLEDFSGLNVYAGLYLSATSDLTSFVMMAQHEGIWNVMPIFWLPSQGIAEKSRHDRVQYDVWAREGYLELTPGKSVEYEYVADYIRELFSELSIRKIAFDRWGFKHLKPWLLKVGFTERQIEEVFVEFGQGFHSMSPALRTLEGLLLNGKISHGNHPVLAMCASNAVVHKDP